MTIASKFKERKYSDDLVKHLEEIAVDVDQDWENESTIYTFSDSSKLCWSGDYFDEITDSDYSIIKVPGPFGKDKRVKIHNSLKLKWVSAPNQAWFLFWGNENSKPIKIFSPEDLEVMIDYIIGLGKLEVMIDYITNSGKKNFTSEND